MNYMKTVFIMLSTLNHLQYKILKMIFLAL
jgi:hypothetical protein